MGVICVPAAGRIQLFRRPFPSANMALITGPRPILIDTGFGSDLAITERLLRDAGQDPASLFLIANTHAHCDHVGGNHALQRGYGIPVAASAIDAALINGRDVNAGDAEFLDQPVEPFRVDGVLAEGDELETGTVVLQVIATPGHTPGHLSFYAPEERVLVLGDVVHNDDVAWLNLCYEGPDPLDVMMGTLDRLAALRVDWACSGHGPRIENLAAVLDAARRRYENWRGKPHKIAWHACKRIFGYELMLEGGMTAERVREYLLAAPWFVAHSRQVFELEPAEFVTPLVDEMLRAGAARWEEGRLVTLTPYTPVSAAWLQQPGMRPKWWQ
jgi:hydroxyacylglutathione hydrolase